MDTYLTVNEVAVMLQLSVQTIRRYTMNKEIPFHKKNRAVRFKKSEIEMWFEKRKQDGNLNLITDCCFPVLSEKSGGKND